MKKEYKVAVFHPMKQHSYYTAELLLDNKKLYMYYTSVFFNKNSLFYKLVSLFLNKKYIKKINEKTNSNLSAKTKTYCMFWGILYLIMFRIDKTKDSRFRYMIGNILTQKMGKKVAKNAIKEKVDVIISYDTWSYGLISELKKRNSNIKVIIDYTSLYSEKIRSIINNDINNNPNLNISYKMMLNRYSDYYIQKFIYEKNNADFYLSPSSIVNSSLIEYGVSRDKIFKIPYGANITKKSDTIRINETLTFVYVGRISFAKGLHYLIKAFKMLERKDYKLLLIGENFDKFDFDKCDGNILYLGKKNHQDVLDILEKADVSITASLFDGFSLSVLEGFCYNLPAIITENVGIKDYIIDGKNGYVVDTLDSNMIKEKIEFLLDNKDKVKEMKKYIRFHNPDLSWENYGKELCNVINVIMEE